MNGTQGGVLPDLSPLYADHSVLQVLKGQESKEEGKDQ